MRARNIATKAGRVADERRVSNVSIGREIHSQSLSDLPPPPSTAGGERRNSNLASSRKRPSGRSLQAAGKLGVGELAVASAVRPGSSLQTPRSSSAKGCKSVSFAEPVLAAMAQDVGLDADANASRVRSRVTFRVHLPGNFGEDHDEESGSPRSPQHAGSSSRSHSECSPRSPVDWWLRRQLSPSTGKKAPPKRNTGDSPRPWRMEKTASSFSTSPRSPKLAVTPPWFVPPPSYSAGQGIWW